MKANKVLEILNITRPTLSSYVKKGLIKAKLLPTRRYDYEEESVYAFIGSKRSKNKKSLYDKRSRKHYNNKARL